MTREIDRRALLRLAAACVAVGACSRDPAPKASPGTAPSGRLSSSPPAASPSPPPPPPPPPRWTPLPAEPLPRLKQVAANFVQDLANREAGGPPEAVLAAALAGVAAPGLDEAAVLTAAAPLLGEPGSRAEVVYPQFGGLVPDGPSARSASVMVVLRQTLVTPSGASKDVVRTCDVRLVQSGGVWRVTALASAGGEPVDRPDGLDPVAVAVLDDPRIDLPDTARWDVHAGRVALDVLRVLRDTAALAPLSVCVLQTGHPVEVFGTARTSDHTKGRAVDVWAVGGQPVIGQASTGSPLRAVIDAAFAHPRVRQVGSPPGTDLDGPARRRSFVNVVHSDHLHLATRGGTG